MRKSLFMRLSNFLPLVESKLLFKLLEKLLMGVSRVEDFSLPDTWFVRGKWVWDYSKNFFLSFLAMMGMMVR